MKITSLFNYTLLALFTLSLSPEHSCASDNDENLYSRGKLPVSRSVKLRNAYGGPGIIHYTEILSADDFGTDILFVRRGTLMPKSGIGEHMHPSADVLITALDGPVRFVIDGSAAELSAGSMVLCTAGSAHGVYNHTDKAVRFIAIGVGKETDDSDITETGSDISKIVPTNPPPFSHLRLDRTLMTQSERSHDGRGPILFRRLFNPEAFTTNWYVVSHAILLPGSSIGLHRHTTREEVYYVISGSGRLTVNDHTYDVSEGDALPCPLGGVHGIWNDSDADLELLVFSASLEKGVVTGEENMGDDLVGR